MNVPKSIKLTEKQLDFLLFIFKFRGATPKQITLAYYPDLDFFSSNTSVKEYNTCIRLTNRTLAILRERNLIRKAGVASGNEHIKMDNAIHQLTDLGLQALYYYLEISIEDKYEKSGFDYELGYFKEITTSLTAHDYVQRDVYALLTWINSKHLALFGERKAMKRKNSEHTFEKEGSSGSSKNSEHMSVFSESPKQVVSRATSIDMSVYGKANICSWRDNLHSSPRPNDIIPVDKKRAYRPDGEVRLTSAVRRLSNGAYYYEKSPREDHYFLEVDMGTEKGNALYEKMTRLVIRLKAFEQVRELEIQKGVMPRADIYKGAIIVIPDSLKENPHKLNAKRHTRFMSFFNSFLKADSRLKSKFNLILTTPKKLEGTLKSLRLEYYYSFEGKLRDVLQHPSMNNCFTPENDNSQFGRFLMMSELGHVLSVQVDVNTIYLFYGIEGYTSWRWFDFVTQYAKLVERVKAQKLSAKVYPIATFSKEMPSPLYFYRDVLDTTNGLSNTERAFYKDLHILSLFTREPQFYYYDVGINGLPHEQQEKL